MRALAAATAAVVVGGTVGWAVQEVVVSQRESAYGDWQRADAERTRIETDAAAERTVGDRVAAAAEGLRDDRVYVAPDGRYLVDEAGEARIAAAVAASELPAYVVVWAPSRLDGTEDFPLEEQLAEVLEEPGVVYVWSGPQVGEVIDLDVTYYAGDGGQIDSATDFVGDPATALSRSLGAVESRDFRVHDGAPEPVRADSSDDWGGIGGGILAGLLIGGGISLLVLVVWLAVGAALRGSRRTAR